MSRAHGLILVVPALLVLAGCGPEGELGAQQSRVIDSPDPNTVLSAAATILRREFGRVQVNPAEHTLVTEPAEFRTTRESGTARDLYRGSSTMRRIAKLNLARRGAQTVARLRIDVERQDTSRYQTMPPASGRISDTPAYTPIDRDAATSERQNMVWTRVRRDRAMERRLLEELQEHFALPAPAGAGPEEASARPVEAP